MAKRTMIAETTKKVGETVKLQGWVATKRDHGKLTFIDLRDRSGVVQCVGYQKMGELTTESVIEIIGEVKARPAKMVNASIPTGTVEIDVKEYVVLNPAKELPIQVDGDGLEINEEVRLRYRYLDLRRERLAKIVKLRSDYFKGMREELYGKTSPKLKHQCSRSPPKKARATSLFHPVCNPENSTRCHKARSSTSNYS